MERREFISGLIGMGGLGVLVGTRQGLALADSPVRPPMEQADLTHLLTHVESARVVGAEYLKSNPEEADCRELRGLLLESLKLKESEMCDWDWSDIQERLRAQVRADFQNSRTVRLNGWVLSETEGRLSALVALAG